jgi:NAD(P)-dependent dehydrogenase (short-subunit alcohol dehydrogenase family)
LYYRGIIPSRQVSRKSITDYLLLFRRSLYILKEIMREEAWRMDTKLVDLAGRVAIVTGAGRGIGRAVADQLVKAGAKVVRADLEGTDGLSFDSGEGAPEEGSLVQVVDVTDEHSIEKMVEATLTAFGRLDILVNNAGIMFRTRVLDITPDEWESVLRVNLTGPFLCTRAALPVMKENGYGRIVNISSSAGRSVSTLGGVHYTASKAGLLGLTRAVAKEAAPWGITANAVCPGLIDTKMVRATTTEPELEEFLDSIPIKRIGSPGEIGDLVVFLCSERASYITGASIDINGGDLMI